VAYLLLEGFSLVRLPIYVLINLSETTVLDQKHEITSPAVITLSKKYKARS